MIYSAFRTRLWHCAVILLVATLVRDSRAEVEARADQPANAAARRVHEEARRILNSIQQTVYQHRTEIDEEAGVYLCDCSGLGIYILNQTVAQDDPQGPLGDGRARPRAMHFYEAFANAPTAANGGGRWQRIERLADARPGDIIAWRRDVVVPGNSGHVVILDQKPVAEESGLVRVVMIDSTTRPQVGDTRGEGQSGIGRGTMWFTVDEDGRPVAYVRGSRDAKPAPVRISIGRALPAEEEDAAARTAA